MSDPSLKGEIEAPPAIQRSYEDARRGYRGHVVVDSLACGHAHGGIRIRPGVSLEEIRAQARVMTWKYRFAGIPQGGAKAGIEGAEDLPREEKARRLDWLADAASELIDTGLFGIGPDLGTDGALVGGVLARRGLLRGRRSFPSRFRGSGFYTALSVIEAASAALDLTGETLRGKRVAVEGFGAVGSHAARVAAARGAQIVAISTSHGMLERSRGLDLEGLLRSPDPLDGDPRAYRLPKEELLRADVDLLLPCGPGGTIDAAVAETIAAPLVVPGANCALSLEAVDVLHARGRLAVPCFAANCGGVTAASLCVGGVPDWAIARLLAGPYRRRLRGLLGRALAERRPPFEVFLRALPPLRGGRESAAAPGRLTRARALLRGSAVPRAAFALPAYLYVRQRIGASR